MLSAKSGEPYRVTARYTGVARVQRRVIYTPALGILKPLAREPIVPPTGLSWRTIGAEAARLPVDISARQGASPEAVFCSLLFSLGGQVPGRQELVHECLVLADAIAKHATVVAIVVDAPLHINYIAALVGNDRRRSPAGSGLVVVDTDTGVVSAWACAPNLGRVEVGPGRDGLEDGALGTCVWSSLSVEPGPAHGECEVPMCLDTGGQGKGLNDRKLHDAVDQEKVLEYNGRTQG